MKLTVVNTKIEKMKLMENTKELAIEVIENYQSEIEDCMAENARDKFFDYARDNVDDLEKLNDIMDTLEESDDNEFDFAQIAKIAKTLQSLNYLQCSSNAAFNSMLRGYIKDIASSNYEKNVVEEVFDLFRIDWEFGEETMMKAIEKAWENGFIDSYNEDGEEDDENPINITIDYHSLLPFLGINTDDKDAVREVIEEDEESGGELFTFFGASCMARFAEKKFGGEWEHHYSEDTLIAYNNAYDFC